MLVRPLPRCWLREERYVRSTLGQRLGGRRDNLVSLGSTNNNLNLDRSTIDEETVQFLEGRASAVGLAEDDRSDATALRVGTIGEFDPLNGANNLDEVFLDLLLRDVLGQVADNDLAVTVGGSSLGEGRLVGGATRSLGRLLDASDGGRRSRATAGRAALDRATSPGGAALGRGDLVERLVELARHRDGIWSKVLFYKKKKKILGYQVVVHGSENRSKQTKIAGVRKESGSGASAAVFASRPLGGKSAR
jgi:hypothetical protein